MTEKRLYRKIVREISALMDSGAFPPGSRLPPERELATQFSVSRPTIREAVIALEATGRVAVKTGSGVYVLARPLGLALDEKASAFELMESRILIEGEAAAQAASLITPEQLAQLAEALAEMDAENSAHDLGPDAADRRFHTIIAEATNNRILLQVIQNLWHAQENVDRIRNVHEAVCQKNPKARLAEHRAIYKALASGDSAGARVAMRQHFGRTMEALHSATEEEAVAEVQMRLSQTRQRFSSERFLDSNSK
ncbi:MAG: FadR/GntR family transcriptional regulator [Pseudomonadota bacterium]